MQYVQLAMAFLGNEQASKMSKQQLELLGKQYADMAGISLPDLEKMTPDQLGESALGQMAPDEALRGKQLAALGEIQNTIDKGGLDLSDRASLEDAMSAATNQQRRARAGVAADAAERGQLNSGNRMVMDTMAAQQGANDARKSGLDVAAMAQRRRLQAIQDSSNLAATMRNEDWNEKEAAARAKDIRDERNANAREKAQYYNASLPQQQFNNQLSKVTGQQPSVNALAGGYQNMAADTRANTAGMVGALGALGNQGQGQSYTYSTNPDETGNRGGAADLSKDDPDFK